MRENLLSILACPKCGGDFRLDDARREGAHVVSGSLPCLACEARFPIENSVPRLLVGAEHKSTRKQFSAQWLQRISGQFEKRELLYGQKLDIQLDWIARECLRGIESGQWFLDAGCGSAEKTLWFARRYPKTNVVGMDMNDAILELGPTMKELPNVDLVQGDVMHPPFKKGAIDKLHSYGVLHHTVDTKRAFERVSELVAPDGDCTIWIYPTGDETPFMQMFYTQRDKHFLGRGHELPPPVLAAALRAYMVVASPWLLLKQLTVIRHTEFPPYVDYSDLSPRERFMTLFFMFYDNTVPTYQHRHRRAEVRGWMTAAGFFDVKNDEFGQYWGRRPKESAVAA
jgi:uncharacterized protein YbaR (Trm112 family)